ncbi:zinc finger protein 253-like isoform X3 [Eurosta solidaginis]|uniref:zinc finger protein 253-like isoform X3 n=1 Tax=Eurosta solidaginis TaxID=178769 RepID=UPI003530808D
MDTDDLHIDYLCRTCMFKLEAFTSEGSAEPQHQSIFEIIEECDELRIADLLSSTIPQIMEVQLSDDLPKKICCKCLHQLISAYRFQKLCVQSEHKMREMVSKKWDYLNMSMMEAAIVDEVLPNDTDSYPLSSCQPKCTAQNSLLRETETALEGRQQAIESESAQWSTAEHLLKNEKLLDYCENSQDELSEFIKNEPIEYDEENTEYSDTIHSTTFVTKEEFTTEEQKVTVPCKENLEDGKQLKHQGNELECDICGKCYRQKRNLKYHKRLHSGEKLYKCDICAMRYKNIWDKKNYQFPCDVCGKRFKTKSVLKRHKRDLCGEKPHKCDICEKRFGQATKLSQHMLTHTGEKPYKCKYCERYFSTKDSLNQHLRVNHFGDDIHRCESCPLAFRFASELRLHSTTHKDEDPETSERNMKALMEMEAKLKQYALERYPCDVCGKHFKTKRVLNIHKRDHSGVKPHKCNFCEMRFSRTTNLRDHMRTHTGEKPYKCKYCDRCFTTKNLLHRHLSVHLGNYIHRCESCPLAFRLASKLRLHSTTHKDDDPETRERNMAALREEEAKLKVNR